MIGCSYLLSPYTYCSSYTLIASLSLFSRSVVVFNHLGLITGTIYMYVHASWHLTIGFCRQLVLYVFSATYRPALVLCTCMDLAMWTCHFAGYCQETSHICSNCNYAEPISLLSGPLDLIDYNWSVFHYRLPWLLQYSASLSSASFLSKSVLNAAVRIIAHISKFSHVSSSNCTGFPPNSYSAKKLGPCP